VPGARSQGSESNSIGSTGFDRGCVKSRRKNANDLADENFSRIFYFRSTSDLENKRKPACENSAEFLHSLDPFQILRLVQKSYVDGPRLQGF
jgi:hypothetical protein